jgi:lipopolysaccharide exporter
MYSRIRNAVEKATSGNGLKARVVRGGAWLATGNVAEQASRFTRNLILVRLLAPAAFGTMAVVLSASSLLQTCTDIGVRDALIQNPKGDKPEYVGAAWWMAFGRALSIYSAIFLIAPLVASFYGNTELTPLLRVAVLTVVFEGAMSSKAYLALKQMKFRKWAVINHGGGICGIATTIVLSVFLRNVWALVLGACAEGAARCALSYVVCPFIPPAKWDKEALRDLLKFSKGQFGLSFLNLIYLRTDIFVLAKLFSAAQLGIYTMGIYLAQVPTSFAMMLLGNLMLPTFSSIQGDNKRTNQIVINLARAIILFGVPTLAFIFFAAHPLLSFIYGERYAAAAAPFFLASCVALINLVNSEATGVFYANGRPRLHRRCVATMAMLMIMATYPLAKIFGLIGGQIACLIAISVGCWFQLKRLSELTGLNLAEYGQFFGVSGGVTMLVVAVCVMARISGLLTGTVAIIIPVAALLMAYTVGALIFLRRSRTEPAVVSHLSSNREDEIIAPSVAAT